MGLKKYHAVFIRINDFWVYDPDSYDSKTKLYGDFTVVKGDSKKDDSDMKRCSYFFEVGNADNHGFKPTSIKYDDAEGFLVIEGEQAPMDKVKRRVFQIGEDARRYKNMRGPRHSVDIIVVSKDSKKQEIKDYLKQQQDDSKGAESFSADTLNQINPTFVEGAEDIMGAESEIFCADCGGRRKYDAESFEAEHSCGCGDEMALEAEGVEGEILDMVEQEGGALGMQNLTGIADENVIQETISDMKEDGILFEHKHGDYYTHEPVEAETFEAPKGQITPFKDAKSGERINMRINSHDMRMFDKLEPYPKTMTLKNLKDGKRYEIRKPQKGKGAEIVKRIDAEDDEIAYKIVEHLVDTGDDEDLLIEVAIYLGIDADKYTDMDKLFDEVEKTIKNTPAKYLYQLDEALMEDMSAEDVVEVVQEVSPFPMSKLFASFIVVGVSAIAGAKLLNR